VDKTGILQFLFFILYWVVFIYSIVLHELAHGWSSLRMGDPTALNAGRLSLNPLKHVDPFFSVLMPILCFISIGVPFGGAKPVPINPYLYRNLRWGSLFSAIAGPATNILIALVCALGFKLSVHLAGGEIKLTGQFFGACLMINVLLAVFNMLPVPPLDGSHVLASLLPRGVQEYFGKFQAMGWWPILGLILVDRMIIERLFQFSLVGFMIGIPTYLLLRAMGVVQDVDDFSALFRMFRGMRLLTGG
jgi:Zn-dependent protease